MGAGGMVWMCCFKGALGGGGQQAQVGTQEGAKDKREGRRVEESPPREGQERRLSNFRKNKPKRLTGRGEKLTFVRHQGVHAGTAAQGHRAPVWVANMNELQVPCVGGCGDLGTSGAAGGSASLQTRNLSHQEEA